MEIQPNDEQRVDVENIENNEYISSKELILHSENVTDSETGNLPNGELNQQKDEEAEEDGSSKREKDKASTSSAATATTVFGAVAAVAIAVVIFINGIVNVVASLVSLSPYGKSMDFVTTIAFDYAPDAENPLDFSNFDTNTFLLVYNNRFNRVIPLVTNFKGDEFGTRLTSQVTYTSDDNKNYKVEITFSGSVEGLTTNTRYKVEVFGFEDNVKKTYANSTIKTMGQRTQFTSVAYKCQCQVDGNLYYWLNYIDENNFYSNFRYSFIDEYDQREVVGGTIANPKDKQSIDVSKFDGSRYRLVVTYDSNDPGDIASGNTTISVTTEVQL